MKCVNLWRLLFPYVILTPGHSDAQGWLSECPDVKNYKWRLNPCLAQDVPIWQQWASVCQRVNNGCILWWPLARRKNFFQITPIVARFVGDFWQVLVCCLLLQTCVNSWAISWNVWTLVSTATSQCSASYRTSTAGGQRWSLSTRAVLTSLSSRRWPDTRQTNRSQSPSRRYTQWIGYRVTRNRGLGLATFWAGV